MGFLKYITKLFPIKGWRIVSKIFVINGFFIKSHTKNLWYCLIRNESSLVFQKRHWSHQYGECNPWAQWKDWYSTPLFIPNFFNWLCLNILTCPPGVLEYSLLSFQHNNSGINLGTLKANTPPGFNTLINSFIDSWGESTCSKTSLQMTASNEESAKGIASISAAPNWHTASIPVVSKSLSLALAIFKSFIDRSRPRIFTWVSMKAPMECLPYPQPISKSNSLLDKLRLLNLMVCIFKLFD